MCVCGNCEVFFALINQHNNAQKIKRNAGLRELTSDRNIRTVAHSILDFLSVCSIHAFCTECFLLLTKNAPVFYI